MSRDYRALTDQLYLPLLTEAIRNACVNDGTPGSGAERRSVQLLDRFFRARGLTGEVLTPPEGESAGRDNYLLRIPGTDPSAPSLMLMGHLDVVPAEPARWEAPPFSAEWRGDELYGRGTVDMLNMTCAMAAAVAALHGEGWRPRGDLLFLATADEENASRFGARWLVDTQWDKVRCDSLITELGGFFCGRPEAPAISVTVGEKGVAWPHIRFSGKPGHGSLPFLAENAVEKATAALTRLQSEWRRLEPPGALPELYRKMVQGLRLGADWEARLLAEEAESRDWALLELAQKHEGLLAGEARFLHAASRTTVSVNGLAGGVKTNIIPAEAEAELDIRLLPGEDRESLERRIREAMGAPGEGAEIRFDDYFPPGVSAEEGPLMAAVRAAAGEIHPGVPLVPFLIGGVTDARFFRAKGVTAYGVTLFSQRMTLGEYAARLHGDNERIDRESLEIGLHFFCRVAELFW